MTTLSEKAQAFMSKNPTVLGVIGDRTYYEHPTLGDEAPMYYLDEGKLYRSKFWDMDSAQDSMWNDIGRDR